jgi:hypothetical protein
MGLGWTLEQEFKVKSICTNKEKKTINAIWNQNGA